LARHRSLVPLLLSLALALLAIPSTAGAYVYWVNAGSTGDTIGRVGNDGSGADPGLIADAEFGPIAADSSHLYFRSESPEIVGSDETIARTNLDGGEALFFPVTFPNGGSIGPGGITVEAVDAGHVYGVDNEGIARAKLDGTDPEPEFITGIGGPGVIGGIAVYDGFIYWTEYDNGAGEGIGRANLITKKADEEFVTLPTPPLGESGPKAIAVDADGIYWTWEEGSGSHNGEIGHAGLGGGSPTIDALPGVNAMNVSGLAIEGSDLYWFNYREGEGSSLAHAHLEGGGSTLDLHFVPHAFGAGLAVNSASVPPPPPPPAAEPGAGSSLASGPGAGPEATPIATPKPPSRPAPLPSPKLALKGKAGTAALTLTVPGPGTLALSGAGIRHLTKRTKSAGPVSLTVSATGKSAARLRRTGKAPVTADLTFTPTSGAPSNRRFPLILKLRSR
jgi:hypothetical protein